MPRIINEDSGEGFDIPESDLEIVKEAYLEDELIFSVQGVFVMEHIYESIKDRLGV